MCKYSKGVAIYLSVSVVECAQAAMGAVGQSRQHKESLSVDGSGCLRCPNKLGASRLSACRCAKRSSANTVTVEEGASMSVSCSAQDEIMDILSPAYGSPSRQCVAAMSKR